MRNEKDARYLVVNFALETFDIGKNSTNKYKNLKTEN